MVQTVNINTTHSLIMKKFSAILGLKIFLKKKKKKKAGDVLEM